MNNHTMAPNACKSADPRSKSIVFGYIHCIVKNLTEYKLPLALKHLCLAYYYCHGEYFTKHGDHIKLSKSRNIAYGTTDSGTINTVYGNQAISLYDGSIKEYQWTFKVSQIINYENKECKDSKFFIIIIVLLNILRNMEIIFN